MDDKDAEDIWNFLKKSIQTILEKHTIQDSSEQLYR